MNSPHQKFFDLLLVQTMSLEEVQAELRLISGSALRAQEDTYYRRELWLRLDHLVREQDQKQRIGD
jgi:hypothetical protein